MEDITLPYFLEWTSPPSPTCGISGWVCLSRSFQKQVLSLQRLPRAGQLSPPLQSMRLKITRRVLSPGSTFLPGETSPHPQPFPEDTQRPHMATRISALLDPDVSTGPTVRTENGGEGWWWTEWVPRPQTLNCHPALDFSHSLSLIWSHETRTPPLPKVTP